MVQASADAVRRAVGAGGGEQPERHADAELHEQRGGGQERGVGKAVEQDVAHVPAVAVGVAEIEPRHVAR